VSDQFTVFFVISQHIACAASPTKVALPFKLSQAPSDGTQSSSLISCSDVSVGMCLTASWKGDAQWLAISWTNASLSFGLDGTSVGWSRPKKPFRYCQLTLIWHLYLCCLLLAGVSCMPKNKKLPFGWWPWKKRVSNYRNLLTTSKGKSTLQPKKRTSRGLLREFCPARLQRISLTLDRAPSHPTRCVPLPVVPSLNRTVMQ
jgi:hypothetical protein